MSLRRKCQVAEPISTTDHPTDHSAPRAISDHTMLGANASARGRERVVPRQTLPDSAEGGDRVQDQHHDHDQYGAADGSQWRVGDRPEGEGDGADLSEAVVENGPGT